MRWLHDVATLKAETWNGEPLIWLIKHRVQDVFSPGRASATDFVDATSLGMERGAMQLARRRLLRRLAGLALGIHPDLIGIDRRPSEGPRIVAPKSLFASCAGRADWNVVAIGCRPIGVDIETRPPEAPLPIDLLHPTEHAYLQGLPEAIVDTVFLKFWAAREAYLKALQRGLGNQLPAIRAQMKSKNMVDLLCDAQTVGTAEIVEDPLYIAAAVALPANEQSYIT